MRLKPTGSHAVHFSDKSTAIQECVSENVNVKSRASPSKTIMGFYTRNIQNTKTGILHNDFPAVSICFFRGSLALHGELLVY